MNLAYLVLKAALNLYGKGPAALAKFELDRVTRVATQQFALESRVLASDDARDVVVPEATLTAAMTEIRGRYEDDATLQNDLASHGLTIDLYAVALERELKVEGVLEKVGSRAVAVSDIEVELYYRYHPEQFQRPESRVARHILVTINEDLPENTRDAARSRIDSVAARLMKEAMRFDEQAMKHSECPTALQGGLLGEVKRGQLYVELEAVLFALEPMQLSGVVESPLGLHLLRCDKVIPSAMLPLVRVGDAIREQLTIRRKRICQSAWLKQLQQTMSQRGANQQTRAA
jgi:peptidyl-prolyl cis-trans isomerase C